MNAPANGLATEPVPRPQSPRPTRTIALMNQKGGVGKTTTTVNLAAVFARAGRPTLIVDLDSQAHATLHLGVDPGSTETSIYDLLLDPSADASTVVRQIAPRLDLLPSHTDLAAAESDLAGEPEREKRLTKVLGPLSGRYEFVLIDCPPSLGLLTLNALAASREVLIPMQPHFLALQGVGKLLETVALISREVNPRLVVTGVVLCMHDSGATHTREVVADLDDFFEQARSRPSDSPIPWRYARVFRPPIRRNIKLAECPSFGKTIFDYAPTASGAEDYSSLAGVLLADWDAMLSRRAGENPTPVVIANPSRLLTQTATVPPTHATPAAQAVA